MKLYIRHAKILAKRFLFFWCLYSFWCSSGITNTRRTTIALLEFVGGVGSAQQEIALRGNDESNNSLNRCNVLEIFSSLSRYIPHI